MGTGDAMSVVCRSLDETLALAGQLGAVLRPGLRVGLTGDLGAGKTTFVRGAVAGMPGGGRERVSSPTWSILQSYRTEPAVHHLDLYRLTTMDELEGVGYLDLPEGVVLVEWPERVADVVRNLDLLVVLRGSEHTLDERREVVFHGQTSAGHAVIHRLFADRQGFERS